MSILLQLKITKKFFNFTGVGQFRRKKPEKAPQGDNYLIKQN